MADISNINYKRFLTDFGLAKKTGASEMRLPIKQVEDLVLELSILLSDKLVEVANNSLSREIIGSDNNISSDTILSGGGFKK